MLDLTEATHNLRSGYAYWLAKCAGRPMPVRADLDPAEMLPFLPHVALMDVLRDPADFRYRLLGTVVDAHMNGRYTGMRLSDLPHQRPPSRMWSHFSAVAETGTPLFSRMPYVGKHKDFMSAQDLLMPLGAPETGVTMIFCIVDFVLRPTGISSE